MASALDRWRGHGPAPPRWPRFLAEVEPALAAVPRVHRFAQPPVLGDARLSASPVAVWIDGPEDRAASTRESLAGSTHEPVAILRGDLQQALAETRVDHVLLLMGGDELAPLALERLGQAVALAGDAHVITCDDDRLAAHGGREQPRFRPGPSPDRWLACDDSGPLLLVDRQATLAQLPGLRGGAAWRHELALRLAGHDGERHAHVPLLLCHRAADAPDLPPLDPEVVAGLVRQRSADAKVSIRGQERRVERAICGEPSVEVIICFRDGPELLARCVTSLRERTAWERLRVTLVDNGSSDPETARLLQRLLAAPGTKVIRDPRPFNFAALNNRALAESEADAVVFLNNDTEVLHDEWLEVLLGEALRPEIGAVAPLLVYPDGAVQHAGAAIGLHGYAGHPFAGLRPEARTAFGAPAQGARNWLAVTAACMMVQRRKLEAAGGFDESFVVGGNDVDLCLRLTAAGHRSLCVPWGPLLHDESRSRGTHVDPGDFAASERSYGSFRTVGDPFYNPNLTLSRTDCSVRIPGE